MKFELGDVVEISKRWKTVEITVPRFEDVKEFEEYCNDRDIDEYIIDIQKMKKVFENDIGVICGYRHSMKTDYTLSLEDDGYSLGDIVQIDSKHVPVYLVATRMNCIYKVSKEDIKFIADTNLQGVI